MNIFQVFYFRKLKKRLCNILDAFIELKVFNSAVRNVTFDLDPKVHFKLNSFINHLFSLFEKFIVQNINKELFYNFITFFIYHQVANNNIFWNRIETEVDLTNKKTLIDFNSQKRDYYYLFLDELKKLDNYNFYLRTILRNTL
ncbi:hypothetical protein CO229_00965 [Mycoplasmopsis bovirhinis]|uniref:hypothetical protein n=1 Tax=Mycoplasmopsis bovirhinis TaxID=29553 RepID=UPI000C058F2F|nr:hypothetical protein [Mycoplasmopsis bovirhinis]ATO30691.1 hypothetical protein CO229_00965 [Mycoplasmopsis bovirhinis]